MKTKFYFLVISLLAICSVCLPACDNDEKGDVTKPVIDVIAVSYTHLTLPTIA